MNIKNNVLLLEVIGACFVGLGLILVLFNLGGGDVNQIVASILLIIVGISIENLAFTIYYGEKKC